MHFSDPIEILIIVTYEIEFADHKFHKIKARKSLKVLILRFNEVKIDF